MLPCSDGRLELSTGVKSSSMLDKINGYSNDTQDGRDANSAIFKMIDRANKLFDDFKYVNGVNPNKATFKSMMYGRVDISELNVKSVIENYELALDSGAIRKSNNTPLSEQTIRTRISSLVAMRKRLSPETLMFSLKPFVLKSESSTVSMQSAKHKMVQLSSLLVSDFIESGSEDSSIVCYLNILKSAMKYHDTTQFTAMSSFCSVIRYAAKAKEVDVLTKEESDYIVNNYDHIKTVATRSESDALDYWISGIFTAARVSDMCKWNSDSLYTSDGTAWLKYTSQKTNTKISLPIPRVLKSVFHKNLKIHGKLLPIIPSTIVTIRIKTLGKKLEIFQRKSSKEVYKDGKLERVVTERWQDLGIHMMRGTAITNLLDSGVKEHIVKSISGHKQNSASFTRYVKPHDSEKIEAMQLLTRSTSSM